MSGVPKMIRVYNKIKRRLSLSKHESRKTDFSTSIFWLFLELLEESSQDPIIEGVTYFARYLGSCSVVIPSGEEATAEAIKSIVQAVISLGIFLLH